MPEMAHPVTSPTILKRRRWRRIAAIAGLTVAAGAIALYYYADRLIERRLRPATIDLLERRLDSKVELASLRVQFTPTLSVRGEGLTVRHHGRTDIPPLISIRAFTISSSVGELWSRHIDRVHLEGLEIMIPPRRRADMPSLTASTGNSGDDPDVYIHELLTEASLLTIMSKREGKRPRVFQLRRIRFQDFQFAEPTPFEAALTNPTPEGEISVTGNFGPWNADEPSVTPIDGSFVFDADLGTIKGIGGAMHAEGKFSGPLEYIRTSGKTKTEGFHLSTGGANFPLLVDYEAIVDATNGDTTLEDVKGLLGESPVTARGEIVRVEGTRGRRITLDTTTTRGRLEDFIKLTTRVESSPMTGIVDVSAKLDIPPGEDEVIERMDLEGTFEVARAHFTSQAIQDRIDELSRRGSGRPTDETIDNVASNLRGAFRLSDGRMMVRRLTFSVRGAEVRLAGAYDLRSERLDFKGELRLQARASRTQTGWRSLVLRVFDPLLDGKGAGTVLPISISGTRSQPKFSADIKKALLK
jgi:AsmA-like C-terminal region